MTVIRCENRECEKNKGGLCGKEAINLEMGKFEGKDEMRCLDFKEVSHDINTE